MDHEIYTFQNLFNRRRFLWPGGKAVALCVVLVLENYELSPSVNAPVRPESAPWRPWFPDFPHTSWRDYGARVGVFRLLEMLSSLQIRTGVVLPGSLAGQEPLRSLLVSAGAEVIGTCRESSETLGESRPAEDERALIRESLDALLEAGCPVAGWMSPGQSESSSTLPLLRKAGIRYVLDWCQDELPVRLGPGRELYGVPASWDMSDVHQLIGQGASPREFAAQIEERHWSLVEEATVRGTGRMHVMLLHPWLSGQPGRARNLRTAFTRIAEDDRTWIAPPGEALEAFLALGDEEAAIHGTDATSSDKFV